MRTSEYPEAFFLSLMTASATHEVRNVLAIIKESAGLIQDLVWSCRNKGVLDENKVSRTVDRIDAQVKRGAELLTKLNQLSHALDEAVSTVDLNEEIQLLAFLSRRQAGKTGHEIEAEAGSPEALSTVPRLRLQMALYTAVECCLEAFPDGTSIHLRATGEGDRPAVEITGAPLDTLSVPGLTATKEWENLTQLLDGMNAVAEPGVDGLGVRILFPPSQGGP